MNISEQDIKFVEERGSALPSVEKQLERFKTGFPYTQLVRPATVSKGILVLDEDQKARMASLFDQDKKDYRICRFIPASGAATRMFKELFSLREELIGKSRQMQLDYIAKKSWNEKFFSILEQYPFFREMGLVGDESPDKLLDLLLGDKGLNYGSLPKGMISFHNYGEISRTAYEEHLHEAARIMVPNQDVKIHFTVSEEHLNGFKSIEKSVVPALEKVYDVSFDISYSFQKKSTDTIAVDLENEPFRDEDGNLVFRPGGHGALIENLNDLDSDIIFINNIDNVSPDSNSENRSLHKKMLGGLLIKFRKEIDSLMEEVSQATEEQSLSAAKQWLNEIANIPIAEDFEAMELSGKKALIHSLLDRPLRVCGMVKNEGEPGGGPFFTENSKGEVSLQIVEKSQINLENDEQAELLSQSSHFNPVDIVCSIKRGDGKKYNLPDYIDPETGFISRKSVKGRDLKALELPGLWNGSMAEWISVFVDIPSSTFTPVKTVFDLVKPAHHT